MHDVYTRILQETKKKNLDGKQLAELLGLKKSPLTDWKNGKSIPTTLQIVDLCEIFAVSADYLLFGKINKLSTDESLLLNKYQKLSNADQQEIQNIIDFKLYKTKEKH